MVIFHSYVSLPEGTSLESGVSENAAALKHLCLSWFFPIKLQVQGGQIC